jgi:hypothetical protein
MAKRTIIQVPGTPPPPEPYPGSERFGDWSLDSVIPLEPGEVLVNDDPEGDPNKLARHGETTKK